ncbi:hypothetical protein Tco_1184227, partial [Tanacetum coccineum]
NYGYNIESWKDFPSREYGSSSEKVEGHGDWDAPEYTNTTSSKEKKVTKALSFYKMETDEVSERYISPCFVNGLDAYDGEINLVLDENLISNEYVMKLCLDYEVKKGNKVVNKKLIIALKGELYFVKFIINPKENNVEPGVIFGRSFTRLVNRILDFGSRVIIVYPEQDLFEEDSEKTEKSTDDWDQLLDFNFDDIPQLDGKELPLFLCKMGKKEGKPVLETMAYNDKCKKVLDEIWKDKVELDGMIEKEEFEGKINKNALADTESDINTMPYRIFEKLGRE